jgi:rifampicin phosphotransferase
VLGLDEIDQTQVAVVGGKGAHLGELARIEGIRVPAGFCVTTDAFRRVMAEASPTDWLEVSGLVNADAYKVRDGEIVAKAIATKERAIHASPGGGTHEQAVGREWRQKPALTVPQVVRLAQLGRRIEAHFGRPQDIEWCLGDDGFDIVQSRPITGLFPIPEAGDEENHVYVSVGHQQMMTDPMKPLGLSLWQLTTARPMLAAGGRLFVTSHGTWLRPRVADASWRALGKSDPLIGDALETILERVDFIRPRPDDVRSGAPAGGAPAPALLDFILADIGELKRILFDPRSHQVFMTPMDAAWWLNEQLQTWLGEKHAADVLTQSVPNNITSEMGLALLDVADVIRQHPNVVAVLERVENEGFLDELAKLPGGREARDAIRGYLEKYGMRCVGEIDITKPRWSERPTTLLPTILGNVENFEPGANRRRFEQGEQEAREKEQELLARLRALPDGERKAEQTREMIDRVRTFIGYREYPKYFMVSRYFVYKQALMEEAERLARAHVLRERETSSTSRSRSSPKWYAQIKRTTSSSASESTCSSRIARSPHPECSPPMARSSAGRTDATICRLAR